MWTLKKCHSNWLFCNLQPHSGWMLIKFHISLTAAARRTSALPINESRKIKETPCPPVCLWLLKDSHVQDGGRKRPDFCPRGRSSLGTESISWLSVICYDEDNACVDVMADTPTRGPTRSGTQTEPETMQTSEWRSVRDPPIKKTLSFLSFWGTLSVNYSGKKNSACVPSASFHLPSSVTNVLYPPGRVSCKSTAGLNMFSLPSVPLTPPPPGAEFLKICRGAGWGARGGGGARAFILLLKR